MFSSKETRSLSAMGLEWIQSLDSLDVTGKALHCGPQDVAVRAQSYLNSNSSAPGKHLPSTSLK